MKILIVCAQFPYPTWSGFTTRVYQLARQLAARHEVTVLSYATADERAGVAALGRQMGVRAVARSPRSAPGKRIAQALSLVSRRPYYSRELYSPELQSALDELCADQRFDLIQVESSLLCALRFPPGVPLVIDEHNVESEVFRRMCESERSPGRRAFNRVEYLRCRRYERECWRAADACLVTSERELPTVAAAAPDTPVAVVPNCVDPAYFTASAVAPAPRTVVFNGILTYRPNVDAALFLIEEVWPLVRARHPDARLTLIGRSEGVDTGSLRAPGVQLLGEVDDIRPHIRGAAVVAVPVRIGGGTRLKVVEGLAMGKALVCTTLGCEGLAVRDREHLLIADAADAFASRITELFEHHERAAALGRAGRRLIEARYSWTMAGDQLDELYRGLAASRLAAGGRLAAATPQPMTAATEAAGRIASRAAGSSAS